MQEIIQFCLENLNYLTITLFMAIESSFIPFPSEVVVPPAAWLACAQGEMNFFLVIFFATVGACIGAFINYNLALTLGRAVVYKFADSRLGHLCLLNGEKVAQSEEYFRRHGVASTFFGRLVPAVRQLISIPAGLSRMDLKKFTLYTALGAGLWNVILAFLGFFIYKMNPDLKTPKDVADLAALYSHEIGYGILAVVALALVYFFVKRFMKAKKAEK